MGGCPPAACRPSQNGAVMTALPVSGHDSIRDEQARRDHRQRRLLALRLPELIHLERLLQEAPKAFQTRVLGHVPVDELALPLYGIELGRNARDVPALLLVGGVHGLERIGTQVVLAWLESLAERLRWDAHLAGLLEKVRIIVLPMLNPGGMFLGRRSNPNGVDLMRNAPISAQERIAFLLGGQRFSPRLPWYIGRPEEGMETESRALQRVIDEEIAGHPFSLSLDCHSGFGWQDQIWFPYAYRRRPMRRIASVMALKLLWDRTYPHHNYAFEPQSTHYLTHGDLWDYFYKRVSRRGDTTFIPLTLEMGSWRWIRKRPRQLFSAQGLFNPQVPHRHERVLRGHLTLIDFLLSAAAHHANWLPNPAQESLLRQTAMMHWYPGQE